MKKQFLKSLLAAALLAVGGVSASWAAAGDVTTNADIDFSNSITGTYAIEGAVGTMTWTQQWAYTPTIVDGVLQFGNFNGGVVELQNNNIGTKDKVTISFELAFGKLNNKHVGFQLNDAAGVPLLTQWFDAYNGDFDDANPLNLDWANMYRGSNTVIWDRRVYFTIVIDYASKKINTHTKCYKDGTSKAATEADAVADWTATTPIAQFVLNGNINNNDRYCSFDNLKITTTEGDYSAATADYTVKYICDGAEIKDAATYSGDVSGDAALTSSDKASFATADGSKRYIYVSDDSEGKTIAADGTTVVTVTYREAEKWSYTVNAVAAGNALDFTETGSVWEDQNSVEVFYPRFLANGTSLVQRAPVGNDLKATVTVTNDNFTTNLEYVAVDPAIDNLYLLSEAEDLQTSLSTSATTFATRVSKKQIVYGAQGDLLTLPAGKYIFTLGVIGGDNNTHKVDYVVFKETTPASGADHNEANKIAAGQCTGNFLTLITSDEFELGGETAISFTCSDPASGRGIDLIYVQKTGEASALAQAKAQLQEAITQATALNAQLNDAELTAAIAVAQTNLDDADATIMTLAAAGNALSTSTTNAMKTALQNAVAAVNSVSILAGATDVQTAIGNANAAVESGELQEMMTAINNLTAALKPYVQTYINQVKAIDTEGKNQAEELAAAITAAEAAFNAADATPLSLAAAVKNLKEAVDAFNEANPTDTDDEEIAAIRAEIEQEVANAEALLQEYGENAVGYATLLDIVTKAHTYLEVSDPPYTLDQYQYALSGLKEAEAKFIEANKPVEVIVNPGFELSEAVTSNVATANSAAGTDYTSTGWKLAQSSTWSNSAVFAYGSDAKLNDVAVPAADNAGNTGKAMGFTVGWGGTQTYQSATAVTLPAGHYTLTAYAYNNNSGATQFKSLFGFVPTNGTSYLSTKTSFAAGQWVEDVVEFDLNEDTEGVFQIGGQAVSGGSGSNAKLFVDNLTISFLSPVTAAQSALAEEIVKAQSLLQTGTAGKDELRAAIETATAAATLTDVAAINAALEALKEAEAAFTRANNIAANAAKVEGASAENPVVSDFVVNGTFDNNVDGWSTTGGFQNQTTANNQSGDFTGNFFENWNPSAKVNKMYQVIDEIPNGTYKLKMAAFVSNFDDPNDSQYVFANSDKTYLVTGEPTFYEVWTVVEDNKVEIGLEQTEAVANWMGIDNVSLTYYGEGDVIEAAKLAAPKADWNLALDEAKAAMNDQAYASVTGDELSALRAQIGKDEPTTAEGYAEATEALNVAKDAFVAAAAAYDALAAANALIVDLPYADAAKKPEAKTATNAEAAAATAQEVMVSLRLYYESNAMAEGVEGAEDFTSAVSAANGDVNTGWTPAIGTNTNEGYTDAAGQVCTKYLDGGWSGSAGCNIDIKREVSVPAGKYLLTVTARGAVDLTEYTLSIGGETIDLPHIGAGVNDGIFGRGWSDASIEFQSVGEPLTLEVVAKSTASKQWMSINRFRLVCLEKVEIIAGDLNGDAEVTTSDAVAVVGIINEKFEPTAAQKKAADVNGDEDINVADVQQIVNLALEISDEPENEPTAGARMSSADNFLTVSNQAVSLHNAQGFTAFQMDITLGEGSVLNGVQLSDRAAGMVLDYNRVADRTYRVVAFSASRTAISGTDGDLLLLDIAGQADVTVSHAIFADAQARAWNVAAAAVTGINGLAIDAQNADIYNVGGQKSNRAVKGLNVVRMADGTVKKVLVK